MGRFLFVFFLIVLSVGVRAADLPVDLKAIQKSAQKTIQKTLIHPNVKPDSQADKANQSRPFPEESKPQLWDRGCEHWPIDLTFRHRHSGLNPLMRIQKKDGAFTFLASVFFEAEKGETPQAVRERVESILLDGKNYPIWTLPGINEKPGGGSYFVDVTGLETVFLPIEQHWVVTGPYQFRLLWIEKSGYSSLSFRWMRDMPYPDCPAFAAPRAKNAKALRLIYRMTPRADLLHLLMAEAWALERDDGAEMKFRLVAKPAPLVYQFLPEVLLRSELEARARRFLQNFIDYRRLRYVPVAKKSP